MVSNAKLEILEHPEEIKKLLKKYERTWCRSLIHIYLKAKTKSYKNMLRGMVKSWNKLMLKINEMIELLETVGSYYNEADGSDK